MLFRARIVLPLVQPPIEDGAVLISGNRIAAVGRWTTLAPAAGRKTMDLGETILLPGLINAHCHLDYTGLAGRIAPPKRFTDWIQALVALKSGWGRADFARSWQAGAPMLLRTGTTTVADIEAVPELIPDLWETTPLRVISFREIITLKSHPTAKATLEAALSQWSALPDAEARVGLSPHAPYTTTPALLELAARAARERHWRLSTHVAESEEEFEMFLYRHGPLYDWLKPQRDMADCGLGSPVSHLERCGYLAENLMAVHANYLWRGDAETLAKHQVSVVHCPRSHDYFQHLLFPRQELAAAGVNICLGTDSLITTYQIRSQPAQLDMFAEMQGLAARAPELPPGDILKMATLNGAQALGRSGELGQLSPHALADLIVIPFNGATSQVSEAVLHHTGEVFASMIDGKWAIAPGAGESQQNRKISG